MRPPRRAHGAWRVLFALAALVIVLPVACLVFLGLLQGRDLAAALRALRAPAPAAVAEAVALPPAPFGPALYAGSLLDHELDEVSGLAASRRSPGVLWAVNDGGNAHRLFALSLEGERLAAWNVAVPEDRWWGDSDWEDLASFRYEGAPYLLIADVGDNWSWRKRVRLWIVPEPDLAEPAVPLVPRWRIDLAYADGPHDCEAVAVDETDLSLLLISKRTAPPLLYGAELAPLLRAGGGEALARPLGPVRVPPPSSERADTFTPELLHMPTALDLAPGGSAAVVLGYAAAWRFPRAAGESWAEAFARTPEQLALPPLVMAEALAYVGESLFVTSEVDRLALVRWRAPLVRFDPLARTDDGS